VDRRGYGVTLAAVNVLGVLCCVFQVMTSSGRLAQEHLKACVHLAQLTLVHLMLRCCHPQPAWTHHIRLSLEETSNPIGNAIAYTLLHVQAVPSLPAQALTLATWCASRVILYSSFYAIVGALFGMFTFGSIIGAISLVTVTLDLMTCNMQDLEQSHHLHGHVNTDSALIQSSVLARACPPHLGAHFAHCHISSAASGTMSTVVRRQYLKQLLRRCAMCNAQGLVTLLILPIANAANQHLQPDDTYWKLNVTQVQVRASRDSAACDAVLHISHTVA
jgi:uncharacterized membrane protein